MKNVKAIAVVVLLVAVGVFAVWQPFREPFTREKWTDATPRMRDRLLAELARSEMLVGLTEQEVYNLLGDPDGESHGKAMYYFRLEGRSRPCLIFRFTRDGYVQSRGLSSMGGTTSSSKFEDETWRNGTPADRLSMVRDLIASHSLEGTHRNDLYALLGDPDRETSTGPLVWYCKRYHDKNGEIKKRLAGASRFLSIHFQDGKVQDVQFAGS